MVGAKNTLFHNFVNHKFVKKRVFSLLQTGNHLFLANKSFVCSVKGEVWEVVDDVHCLGDPIYIIISKISHSYPRALNKLSNVIESVISISRGWAPI